MKTADDFREELHNFLIEAERNGFPALEMTAGQLHRSAGEYPKYLALCCEVMRQEMTTGDSVRYEPRPGLNGSLMIRYILPRPKARAK